MKKLIFAPMVAAAMLFTTSAFAQFNVGAGLFANKYSGDGGKLQPGLQLRLGYDFKEGKAGITGGLNFSPVKSTVDGLPILYNNSTGTGTQDVTGKYSQGVQNIFFHLHYRFGAPENNFHFKIFGGASFDMLSGKYTATGTVPSGYTMDDAYKSASATGPKIDLGIGGDYKMGPGDFFGEIELGIPANKENDVYIYNPTTAHYGVTVSYKFYFGSRDGNGY